MILYCSSGRLTTHMLQPMMASTWWSLRNLVRKRSTSDLWSPDVVSSVVLTFDPQSVAVAKVWKQVSESLVCRILNGMRFEFILRSKIFSCFCTASGFCPNKNYHKIVLSVKKCALFTSQTFIKTAESWVHLLLWTWQNVCCIVLKLKNNQREPILSAARRGEEASRQGMNFYSCTADCFSPAGEDKEEEEFVLQSVKREKERSWFVGDEGVSVCLHTHSWAADQEIKYVSLVK